MRARGRPRNCCTKSPAGGSRRNAPHSRPGDRHRRHSTSFSGRSERSIALVGHEPDLSRLASLLCTGSEDGLQLELKKGAVASLSFPGPVEPARACLRWTVSPKILRRLDR